MILLPEGVPMFYMGSSSFSSIASISHQADLPGGNLWPPYTQISSKLPSINMWGPGGGRTTRQKEARCMQITPGHYLGSVVNWRGDLINRSLHISFCRTFRRRSFVRLSSPSEMSYHSFNTPPRHELSARWWLPSCSVQINQVLK